MSFLSFFRQVSKLVRCSHESSPGKHIGPELASECAGCKRATCAAACLACRRPALRCAVCAMAVRGLAAACALCGHAGHAAHVRLWSVLPVLPVLHSISCTVLNRWRIKVGTCLGCGMMKKAKEQKCLPLKKIPST